MGRLPYEICSFFGIKILQERPGYLFSSRGIGFFILDRDLFFVFLGALRGSIDFFILEAATRKPEIPDCLIGDPLQTISERIVSP
jgi:hypothetical protein